MASPPHAGDGVEKCGYLRKQKHGHKRFFVLKAPGNGCPARLECYENEKKWRNRSAARRVIPLDSCLNISRRADAKHRHLIALYTKDEYFAVAADCELEQEEWYAALAGLMTGGKVHAGSESSLVGLEDADYGMITPASAAYKEVWQVNLKSKGLGQSKNLTGVYRLCLSSRTISFVKLNSEVASVVLQLMNIRRCGHSDSFFFIEVGRSASTGPGELWMQADDSVVAQNIHETILEAMKAMKELSEFRPRSKSQSSGTNPISVPTRRHLNNLPPSQTGLLRRSRTDSTTATSPVGKFSSCRVRTASEGDGTMTRPVSVNGSPVSPCASRAPLGRSNTVTARPSRIFEMSALQHSKSMSMPVSRSPPSIASPVSLSSSSGNGSASDTLPRPPSACASVSGSPSDAGFMSCDEYGSSPGDLRPHLGNRSDTPEYMTDTPPSRDGSDLNGYELMERQAGECWRKCRHEESDKAYRKRTYSLTTPPQQRAPSQVSSTSLDEYTLMRATCSALSGRGLRNVSPKIAYPEDYGDVEIGSLRSSSSNLGDDGYVQMTPGLVPLTGRSENYMAMSPMTVSAPKQIINPRVHPPMAGSGGRVASPSGSLDDSGYLRMLCGHKLSIESSDGKLVNGEYMNMSPVEPCVSFTPPDCFPGCLASESQRTLSSSTLLRSHRTPTRNSDDNDQYVMMRSLQAQKAVDEMSCWVTPANSPSPRLSWGESLRGRVNRPTRLSLEMVRTLPSMQELPLPKEPKSPGEYINIDFSEAARCSFTSLPLGGRATSPLSSCMNMDQGTVSPSPIVASSGGLPSLPCSHQLDEVKDDYTEMSFTAPGPSSQSTDGTPQPISPSGSMQQLTLEDQPVSGIETFLVPVVQPDPDRGAKVIRADPQGRRRHSSETFSSTTTVTPVFPSFAHDPRRHGSASVENVWARGSQSSDGEAGSPMCRETSAGFQNGLNYIALNLMDESLGACKSLMQLKATSCCKGGINALHGVPFVSLAFKEAAAVVKD
ncbi:insulin receptor substrate 2-like [Brienomyrus brachyistius]|uniref:insulin receptor substrate 2-like n=1 Tax=Brienomyrus brachyistius TaxID=42636 RepID=UPI0020B428CA|nr:insulin receptor substrate 2-like [Brienomyrus brachyistius]